MLGQVDDAGQVPEPHKFVQNVDIQIAGLRSLAVAFDPTKTAQIDDVFSKVSSALGEQAEATPQAEATK